MDYDLFEENSRPCKAVLSSDPEDRNLSKEEEQERETQKLQKFLVITEELRTDMEIKYQYQQYIILVICLTAKLLTAAWHLITIFHFIEYLEEFDNPGIYFPPFDSNFNPRNIMN